MKKKLVWILGGLLLALAVWFLAPRTLVPAQGYPVILIRDAENRDVTGQVDQEALMEFLSSLRFRVHMPAEFSEKPEKLRYQIVLSRKAYAMPSVYICESEVWWYDGFLDGWIPLCYHAETEKDFFCP